MFIYQTCDSGRGLFGFHEMISLPRVQSHLGVICMQGFPVPGRFRAMTGDFKVPLQGPRTRVIKAGSECPYKIP